MIIKAKRRLPIVVSDRENHLPVLPLYTAVLFPGMMLTVHVGRPSSLKIIDSCLSNNSELVVSYSPAGTARTNHAEVCQVGVIAAVRDCRSGPGGSKVVTIEGLKRIVLDRIVSEEPFLVAAVNELQQPDLVGRNIGSSMDEAQNLVGEITRLDPAHSAEQLYILDLHKTDPSLLADRVASVFNFPLEARQQLLAEIDLKSRYEYLLKHLKAELNRVVLVHNIEKSAKENIEQEREEQFLRQQLREIKRKLGDEFAEEKEAARIKNQIKKMSNLPEEVVTRAIIEADRLSQLSTASAEYGVTKNYLDWLLSLPWGTCTPEEYKISEAERILSRDYYGPVSVKEQILQRISVRKLLGGVNEGPTLCLVGGPGTGKASLAKAIARCLGKEFVRISVGGISDVAEIKGTPRTFLGAFPGKILRTIREVGRCDPVVLIEDIDYFNMDNDSAVNMALTDAFDVRKNSRFLDRYLGVPFDLSSAFFICSVRSWEEIPEQFIPRLEIIELPGYIEREKIVISKKYIIPDMLKKHGIKRTELKFTDQALSKIISAYTQEAGLLGFSQQIEKISRKVAMAKAQNGKPAWKIDVKNLESYLGPTVFIPEKAEIAPEIGIAAGLAWTGSGGDIMFIEGLKMKGDGQIITTGSLGEIMRESIQAAHSYVRSKADMLGIDADDFNQFDIHIHFPSGAIPKDGPSAGITVCLVIASVMAERPIRNDIAMTGEITLRGKVLPVGGVKEKISAAYRTGIRNVAIPKQNQKDIKELPKEIIRKTKFTFVDRVDELFELCLLNFTPSAYTLEKLFAEEMKKAKKKNKTKTKRTSKSKTRAAGARKKK